MSEILSTVYRSLKFRNHAEPPRKSNFMFLVRHSTGHYWTHIDRWDILMKKIYIFRGRKGENKPSEPKNEICAPKSV
jgi:hypothetical protein